MRDKNKLRENLNTIKRCFGVTDKLDKGHTKRHFAVQIPSIIQEYLHVFQVTRLIDMVISERSWQDIVVFVIVTGMIELMLFAAQYIIERQKNCHNFSYSINKRKTVWEKILNMDYVHIEKPDTYVMERRAI